jgi:hypothetical protein
MSVKREDIKIGKVESLNPISIKIISGDPELDSRCDQIWENLEATIKATEETAKAEIQRLEQDIETYGEVIKILPHAKLGHKIRQSLSCGTPELHLKAEKRHKQWQKDAERIWHKHPTYSPWRVAEELEERYKDDPEFEGKQDTISRIIKK